MKIYMIFVKWKVTDFGESAFLKAFSCIERKNWMNTDYKEQNMIMVKSVQSFSLDGFSEPYLTMFTLHLDMLLLPLKCDTTYQKLYQLFVTAFQSEKRL